MSRDIVSSTDNYPANLKEENRELREMLLSVKLYLSNLWHEGVVTFPSDIETVLARMDNLLAHYDAEGNEKKPKLHIATEIYDLPKGLEKTEPAGGQFDEPFLKEQSKGR